MNGREAAVGQGRTDITGTDDIDVTALLDRLEVALDRLAAVQAAERARLDALASAAEDSIAALDALIDAG